MLEHGLCGRSAVKKTESQTLTTVDNFSRESLTITVNYVLKLADAVNTGLASERVAKFGKTDTNRQ